MLRLSKVHAVPCNFTCTHAQSWIDRHILRTVDTKSWVRNHEKSTERIRSSRRDTPWCLVDSSGSACLPVLNAWTAKYLPWEYTGQP